MGKNTKLALLLLILVMIPLISATARADQTDKLIKILIKKGIITSEEAKSLEAEIKEEEASERQAKAKPAGVDDWTHDVEVGYNKGAYMKTTDDRFSLKINVRTQGLFSYSAQNDQDDTTTFRVRRARFLAGGNLFYPWMNYGTQVTLEGGSTALRDAYIEATYFESAKPRIGQYKVPFDREFLTSAFNLQLIDRSIASDEFSLQRDIGVQLSGKFFQKMLEYSAGVFNGSGVNQSNVNRDYMYLARIVLTPFGSYPYSQAALDTPETPKIAFGLAGAYLPNLDPGERKTQAGILGDTNVLPVASDVYQLTADLAFKYLNFSMESGYHFRCIDPDKPTLYGKESAQGFYLQGGYFVIPEKLEVATRYSFTDPDSPNRDDHNKAQEFTAGLSYYLYGHDLKLQANYSFFRTETDIDDQDEHLGQGMVTLAF